MEDRFLGNKYKYVWIASIVLLVPQISMPFPVEVKEANEIADLWYKEQMTKGDGTEDEQEIAAKAGEIPKSQTFYLEQSGELVSKKPKKGILAYIVVYEPSGFVVVSPDDTLTAVIAYSGDSRFSWEDSPENAFRDLLVWDLTGRMKKIKANHSTSRGNSEHKSWSYLREQLQRKNRLDSSTLSEEMKKGTPRFGTTEILWKTPNWGQGQYYNTEAKARNGNNNVPVGCVALAMAEKMRAMKWPDTGESQWGYPDIWGSIRYTHPIVYFSQENYLWENMPYDDLTTENTDIARLLYIIGVANVTNYELAGSSADVDRSEEEMREHFKYVGSPYSGITDPNDPNIPTEWGRHLQEIKESVIAGLPTITALYNVAQKVGHSVLVDGYHDINANAYYHMNLGYKGQNNVYYDLNAVLVEFTNMTTIGCAPYQQPSNYVYVDGSYTGTENGRVTTTKKSIRGGMSITPAGGSLWIKYGTYNSEPLPMTFTNAIIRSYGETQAAQVNIGNRLKMKMKMTSIKTEAVTVAPNDLYNPTTGKIEIVDTGHRIRILNGHRLTINSVKP